MNDDDLKKLWQEQTLRPPAISAAQVISAAQNKMSHFRRSIAARDLRELLACAVVFLVFGWYAYVERTPLVRVGWLIVAGGAIFIAARLLYARWTTRPAPASVTIAESLRTELQAVRAQSRLLGSILWWYLLPLGVGLLVATWGMPVHVGAKIPSTLFFVALYGFIYWLNQRARSRQILPMEAQLQSLLRSIETGQPIDQAEVADLRPIVLSMASAQHVRPAEFKVAFWQIALWGEIGFIGMWFFLMLSLPLKAPDREPEAHLAGPVVDRVTETNRYSAVARMVVDQLNAADFPGIQALFNSQMSAGLPPAKAAGFLAGLADKYGHIQTIDGPTHDGHRGWTAYHLRAQRGTLTMSLALDENDKIAGVHFRPTTRPLKVGSITRQLFSWQRLLWIVPFFLAGLLFSRLLQKGTERAVGISALGIHLELGQTLLLWDEIKEIRSFRFLNIRSLWLIKESGEKTIMPWTSLERPADLKAAIEQCAPPEHQMRQYLSLLKRV